MAEENGTEGTEGTQGTEGQDQQSGTDTGQQQGTEGNQGAAGDGTGDQGSAGAQGTEGGQQGTEGAGESEGGQQAAEWRAAIADDELRKQADRYGSIDDILKHNSSLRQKVSKALVLPGENATDEELQEFRTKLGVPESPDKYDYSVPDDMPDFIKGAVSDAELKDDMEAAHKAGLTKAQFHAMMNYRMEKLVEADGAYAKQLEEARAKADGVLRREWGREYEANVNLAKRALDNFADDGMMEWLTKTTVEGEQLANHPHILRWAASVGRRMQEGNIHMEHDAGTAQTMQEQHADLTRRIHEARESGNFDEAKRLDKERSELSANLWGTGDIVGQGGRAA